MSFKLVLITPEAKLLEDEIDVVTVPGIDGSFSILENHAPIIAGIGKGTLIIKQKEIIKNYLVESGFLEVSNGIVSVLADKAKIIED